MHRYAATESIAYYFAYISEVGALEKGKEIQRRNKSFKSARSYLYNGTVCFVLGILFFAIAVLLLCIPSCEPNNVSANPLDDGKIEVGLLQVNDVYEITPLDEGKAGGMARIAAYKKHCLSQNANTLLIMAGDFLSPSVYNNMIKDSALVAGKQMIDVMNAAGFDLAIFGNHEFDISDALLQQRIDESSFQWVASNAFYKNINTHFKRNNKDIPGVWIKEFTDKDGTSARIGFLGITTNSNRTAYVVYDTTFERISKLYNELKKSCDAVIAVTHQDMKDDIALAKMLPELTAIIGGHEHNLQYKKEGNVYITKAHSNARSAFYIKLLIDKKNHITKAEPELKYLDTSVAFDALTNALVQKWTADMRAYFEKNGYHIDSVIYKGPPLDGRDESVRKDNNNNLAKIIKQAMESAYPDAKLAIFNAGSIRVDDVLQSPVTQYDILRALPYGGIIKEAEIKGDTLILMLNMNVRNENAGGFLQYSDYVTKKLGAWYIGNTAINESAYYRVAIAEYLTKGNAQIKIIDPGKFTNNDVRSDIRLAVIKQMSKTTTKKK